MTRGKRNSFKNSTEKPEGRSPLGRIRRGWEDNIKKALKE
jgi:hypothetical protein